MTEVALQIYKKSMDYFKTLPEQMIIKRKITKVDSTIEKEL